MKYIIILFVLLSHFLHTNAQTDMDIFILMGQSNMAGRGNPDEQQLNLDSVYMLDKNGHWIPASEPIHFDKSVAGTGLAASFAVEVRESGRKIGLVPCAVGGTPIESWMPNVVDKATGYTVYNDAVNRIKTALKSGRLKGILWHQGESNSSKGGYKTYEDNFEKLLANLERDLSINIDTVPLITGELGSFFITKEPMKENEGLIINSIQHHLAQKKINRYCVSAAGLNHKGDETHFDTPSLRELGKRYAEGYKTVRKKMSQ